MKSDRGIPPIRDLLMRAILSGLSGLLPATSTFAQDVPIEPVSEPAASAAAVELGRIKVTAGQAGPYTVEDSASATPLDLSLRETPQSVTAITRERLDDQNLQSLRDVLDNTTGIYSYAYDTERVVFTSRGFFIDSLMYDGVPAATNFSTGSVDETLDTGLYERIEVVRGATGLMSGAGSPSASVNLVRKRPNSRSFAAQADVVAGSWDDRRAMLDLSTPLTDGGNVRARMVGVYQQRESYQDLYEHEKQVLYAAVEGDLTPNTLLSVGYDYQQTQPQSNTWGSFPLFLADGSRTDWPRSITTATDWSFWSKRKQTGFAEIRHGFANGGSIRSTLTHRQEDQDLALFYVFGFPDPETGAGLLPFAYRNKVDTKQNALDLQAASPFDAFGRQHELVIGFNGSQIEIGGEEFAPGELADTGNFFEWDGSYPMPQFAAEGVNITDIDTRQNSFYAAARLVLAERLKLIAGARHDVWKSDYFYIYTSPDPFEHEHTHTTPYAGLVYDFTPSFSAFASYTEIFNPQNAQDYTGRFLDPIDGRSYEIGIKAEHFDRRLNTALTLFETRQNNVAEPDFDPVSGAPRFIPGRAATQASRSVDGTKTRGFELEAAGELRPGWNASFGWSRYLLEDGAGESVKSYIPRTLVRLFTTWTPTGALDKFTLGGGVNWQSGSNLDVGGPLGLTNIAQGSVALAGVMARYRFTPAFSLQLNASNLLDKKYYVFDEYGNLYFGPPASASASLSYRF